MIALGLIICCFTLFEGAIFSLGGNDKLHHATGFCALMPPGAFLYRRSLYWLFPAVTFFGGAINLSSHA